MAAIQCQFRRTTCNNKTTDPSGLCHLHRSVGGAAARLSQSSSSAFAAPTSSAPKPAVHPLPQLKGGTVVTQLGQGTDLLTVEGKDDEGYDQSAIYDLGSGKSVLGFKYEKDGDERVAFVVGNEQYIISRAQHSSDDEFSTAVRGQFDDLVEELEEDGYSTELPEDLVVRGN